MTPKEAAALVGCSPEHLTLLTRRGKIKATRHGRSYIVNRRSAQAYADREQTRGFPRGRKRSGLRGKLEED